MTITITGKIAQAGRVTSFVAFPPAGDLGVYAGGINASNVIQSSMEYIIISTESNATFWGNLVEGVRDSHIATSSNGSGNRGIFAGGATTGGVTVDTIEYITMTGLSDAVNFGDLITVRKGLTAASNHTRAVIAGGVLTNAMQYINISSEGNATEIGDLLVASSFWNSGLSNTTNDRAVFAIGVNNNGASAEDIINFITISSDSNASFFGNLTVPRHASAATSNHTNERGIFAGGVTAVGDVYNDVIDYITISSAGTATDFGDMTAPTFAPEGISNGVNERGVLGGGSLVGSIEINTIEYVTISTPGNATAFGEFVLSERTAHGGVSNA